ncbi:hypothetical protein [Mesomycoplasma ovipneumoniae]|uniref:hypothetical protein n=1 Tax=Mesomycoplasma ovipneumoniae TaxID=29562 RepID=UPI0026DD4AC1|nr:hypothetical protein [Mesomycoplasma ovipneumoniae]MDO4158773.1 hypothetical protein [Mesomycoplasma ovipneumoniae]
MVRFRIQCFSLMLFFLGLPVWWQKLRQRVEFNTSDQQIMFKNRDGIPSESNIWNR